MFWTSQPISPVHLSGSAGRSADILGQNADPLTLPPRVLLFKRLKVKMVLRQKHSGTGACTYVTSVEFRKEEGRDCEPRTVTYCLMRANTF